MAFGNTFNVRNLMASTPQAPIYAMRTPRAISMEEILSRTQLSADEVHRFNPVLKDRVPARATLYLPFHVSEFGVDVAFSRRVVPTPRMQQSLTISCASSPARSAGTTRGFAPVLKEFPAPVH